MNSSDSVKHSPSPFPCVFILGMHRSGTSCLTGMLADHGLYIGEVKQKGVFNPRGNQEIPEVRSIDNQLLSLAGGSWFQPVLVTSPSPLLVRQIQALRRDMENKHRPWGIKDPRMLFCLDAWFRPGDRMVAVFRHPAACAASLDRRNRQRPADKQVPFQGNQWHVLWNQYNTRLLELYRRHPFPIVNFDWPPRRFYRAVAHMARRLGLEHSGGGFFQADLRHHSSPEDKESVPAVHMKLYRQLAAAAQIEEGKS